MVLGGFRYLYTFTLGTLGTLGLMTVDLPWEVPSWVGCGMWDPGTEGWEAAILVMNAYLQLFPPTTTSNSLHLPIANAVLV